MPLGKLLMVDDDHPYANSTAAYEVHGKGMLGTVNFFGALSYIVKPLADPDMISRCYIHECNATELNLVHPLQSQSNYRITGQKNGLCGTTIIGDSIITRFYHKKMQNRNHYRIRIRSSRSLVLKWTSSFHGWKIRKFIIIFRH